MGWLTDKQWFLGAVVLYGMSALYTIFLWRKGFRKDNRVNYALILLGFAFHSWAMVQRGFSLSRCPINNLYEATTFIIWTMVIVYLLLGWLARLRFLGAFASPFLLCMGVFALMPGLDQQNSLQLVHGLRSVHASLTLLACGGFGLSAVAGLMFLTQEHNLKFNKLQAVASLMPPIQRLEKIAGIMLYAAFSFLTLGLVTGSLWLRQTRGSFFQSDPIILWSIMVWFFYGGVVWSHARLNRRGRRFAWSTVGGFLFVILTFWGFYLLSPVHHH